MKINNQVGAVEVQQLSRRSNNGPNFSDIHGEIHPADIRAKERVLARIRPRKGDSAFESVRVWRLSPLGIELVADSLDLHLEKGQPIDLELVVAGQRTVFEGLVVDVVGNHDGIGFLGVRLSRKLVSAVPGVERRTGERWLCSDDFLPTCVAPTPGRFDDFMYFQVRDISADGLQLSCSLRNKFLIPGMRFSLTTVFPMAQVIALDVEVVRVSIAAYAGRDRLVIGTKFKSLPEHARSILGQYILQFGNVETLEDLRKVGLAPKSVSLGVDFYNLKSEDDYRAVLDLRLLAHTRDGNIGEGGSADDLADINDARARIIVGKYKGRTVATARVRFNDLDEPLEHEEFVEWPKSLPRRDQIVEISRVATHPDFRKNDLLAALFRYCYLNVVQSDRPWVVISCLDHMVSFYEKIGFSQTGLRHTEPLWKSDRVLNILIININELIVGRGVNPFYWNIMWRDVAQYMSSQSAIDPTGIDKIRLIAYRAFGPISSLALKYLRLTRPTKKKLDLPK
jgi:predicted GNAT family N-acyltransferase